jgi:hypothetical protein
MRVGLRAPSVACPSASAFELGALSSVKVGGVAEPQPGWTWAEWLAAAADAVGTVQAHAVSTLEQHMADASARYSRAAHVEGASDAASLCPVSSYSTPAFVLAVMDPAFTPFARAVSRLVAAEMLRTPLPPGALPAMATAASMTRDVDAAVRCRVTVMASSCSAGVDVAASLVPQTPVTVPSPVVISVSTSTKRVSTATRAAGADRLVDGVCAD